MPWFLLDTIGLARTFEALPRQTLTFSDLTQLQGSEHPWKYYYQSDTVMKDF